MKIILPIAEFSVIVITFLGSIAPCFRDSLDEQFLKTLKSQEARFEKELREKREEREARKIKAYQELIRLRKESRARLQAFMACLELKIRWEQQEQDWSDWLKDTRAPLIRIKTKFTMFSSKWRRTDEDENKVTIQKYILFQKLNFLFSGRSFIHPKPCTRSLLYIGF